MLLLYLFWRSKAIVLLVWEDKQSISIEAKHVLVSTGHHKSIRGQMYICGNVTFVLMLRQSGRDESETHICDTIKSLKAN